MSYWICIVQDICPISVQMKVSPWISWKFINFSNEYKLAFGAIQN